MYRFYFKLRNDKNCIIKFHDIIAKNSVIAYKIIKQQFYTLKAELITRKEVLYKR